MFSGGGGSVRMLAPGPPLVRSASAPLQEWIEQWRRRLAAKATLKQGSFSQMTGAGSFGPNYTNHRVWTVHLEIENGTGHALNTGPNLYVLETAVAPTAGEKGETPLEVFGGYFREPPVEDFSGVAEFRRPMKIGDVGFHRAEEEDEAFGLLNWQSGALKQLGPMMTITTSFAVANAPKGFGAASPEKSLVIDSELHLVVVVSRNKLGQVIVISPALNFGQGEQRAVFRLLARFARTPEEKGAVRKDDGEQEKDEPLWTQAGTELLPMNGEALLPLVSSQTEPMWRRIFAARWAGDYAGATAAGPLVALVAAKGKENDAVRAAAVVGLGGTGQASALETLLGVLGDKSEHSVPRDAAINALGKLGDPRAVPPLVALARLKRDPQTRLALRALSRIPDKTAVEPLLGMLEDPSGDHHYNTGQALGRLVDDSALPRLEKLAKNAKAKGSEAAIDAMGSVGSQAAVAILAGMVAYGTEQQRKTVLSALGKAEHADALAVLKGALTDSSKDIREAALSAISVRDTAERRAALLEILRGQDAALQADAMKALAEVNAAEATPLILAFLSNAGVDKELREKAAQALIRYPGKESEQALTTAASDQQAGLRRAALATLRELKATSALPSVRKALKDPDVDVRSTAASAVGALGGAADTGALVDLLLQEKEERPLRAQVDALIRLGHKDLSAFPRILDRLKGAGDDQRSVLRELLKHQSGVDFGPDYGASPKQVEESLAKWRQWLEKPSAGRK